MRPRRTLLLVAIILGAQVVALAQSSDETRLSITKNVMDQIIHNQIASVRGQFSPELKHALTDDDMSVLFNKLVEEAGLFQKQISQTKKTVQGTPTYISTSQFETFKVELKSVFDDTNQITDFWIGPVSDLSPEKMEASAKELVGLLSDQHFDELSSKFNERMRASMPPEHLEASWSHIMMHLGQFKGIQIAQKDPDFDRVDVRCEFENGLIIVRIAFDPSGNVGGLWMLPAEPDSDSKT